MLSSQAEGDGGLGIAIQVETLRSYGFLDYSVEESIGPVISDVRFERRRRI